MKLSANGYRVYLGRKGTHQKWNKDYFKVKTYELQQMQEEILPERPLLIKWSFISQLPPISPPGP